MQKALLAIMLVSMPVACTIGGYLFIVSIVLVGKFALFYDNLKIAFSPEHPDVAALKYASTEGERRYA